MGNYQNSHFIPIPQYITEAEILLINADFAKNELGMDSPHENHLGLNRLSSYLHSQDISSQILNTTGYTKSTNGSEQLAKWLNKHTDNYNSLGFYLTSWNISYLKRIINNLSEDIKNKPFIFGGPLPSANPEYLIHYLQKLGLNNIALVHGYGEFALANLIHNINNFKNVSGVWSWQNQLLTKGHLLRLSTSDLANLPFLNHDYNTFYQLYYRPVLENNNLNNQSISTIFGSFGLETNHGCPFNCSYCSVPLLSNKIDSFTPARIVDEMERICRATGIFMFTFTYSNVMFLTKDWLHMFTKEILKRGLEEYISWNGYQHPNVLDLYNINDFELMRESGCDEIVIGIQSVEKNILKYFNRPLDTFEKVKRLKQKLNKTGQKLVVDYITNVPNENIKPIIEFYRYCLNEDIQCRNYDLKIYPNTELSSRQLNLTNHELTPITGDIPPELGAYLLINKNTRPELTEWQMRIHKNNQEIEKNRPIKIGRTTLRSPLEAKQYLTDIIPTKSQYPKKIKQALKILINELITPQSIPQQNQPKQMAELFKQIFSPNPPPVLLKIKEKMRKEMGEKKFRFLEQKYS